MWQKYLCFIAHTRSLGMKTALTEIDLCFNIVPYTRDFFPIHYILPVFKYIRKHCEKWLLASSCLYISPICPSVRMEQLSSHQMDFHEILYLSIFWKFVTKMQVSLKSDKNNVQFKRRPIYIFRHILLNSS